MKKLQVLKLHSNRLDGLTQKMARLMKQLKLLTVEDNPFTDYGRHVPKWLIQYCTRFSERNPMSTILGVPVSQYLCHVFSAIRV